MNELNKSSSLTLLFTAVFFYIVSTWPVSTNYNALVVLGAAAALIFGVVVVFSISNSHERINKVNELLKNEDSSNLTLFKLSDVFDNEVQEKIKKLLDLYLIDQIDYRLEDFNSSQKSFDNLFNYVIKLKPKNFNQEEAYKLMLATISKSVENRTLIETLTTHKLSKHEWISISGLTFVVISLLYEMSDNNFFHSIILTILASSSFLLVLILRDLDNLKWQKDVWTWKPLHNLFKELGLVPYYPKRIVDIGEAKIPNGDKVRLATYPNKYPSMEGKVVEEVIYSKKKF